MLSFTSFKRAYNVHPPTLSILFPSDKTDSDLEQMTLFFPTLDHFLPAGGALSRSPSSSCLAQAHFFSSNHFASKKWNFGCCVPGLDAGAVQESLWAVMLLSLPSSTKGVQLQVWLGSAGECKGMGKQN